MIIGLIVGILNGLFASGAGQILVLYLIFIKKIETHKVRSISVPILATSSIIALILYSFKVKINYIYLIIFVIISVITGIIGSNLMKKIDSNILNLISGIILVLLTGYKLLKG